MASIRKEIRINAPASQIWDALQDVGALHTRLVRGFVTDTKMDGNARIVTFGNGMTVCEEIVSIEPTRQRVAWAVIGQSFRHYSGAAWVESDPKGGSRFFWTADLLPDELAPQVDQMMTEGIEAVKRTLEASAQAA